MALGTLVKAFSAYFLIGSPRLAALGAPISTLLCDVTVTAINLYYVNKYAPKLDSVSRLYLKPLAASVAMMTVSFATYLLGLRFFKSESGAFIVAMVAAMAAYFVFAFVFGAIEKEDILALPFGERLSGVVRRLGLFSEKRVKDK